MSLNGAFIDHRRSQSSPADPLTLSYPSLSNIFMALFQYLDSSGPLTQTLGLFSTVTDSLSLFPKETSTLLFSRTSRKYEDTANKADIMTTIEVHVRMETFFPDILSIFGSTAELVALESYSLFCGHNH